MELQELKNIWNEYDKKLDKNLQLNMQLLRKMNFDKVERKANTVLIYKSLEMSVLLAMMIYLYSFAIQYFKIPQFSVSALVIALIITAGFISDIRQMAIVIQLRSNSAASIAPMQRKITKLKLLIINYVRWSLLTILFFPFLLLLSGKILFDIDFWELKRHTYFITNGVFAITLIPLFIWLYLQLGKSNLKQTWAKHLLVGTGWYQAQAAEKFLKEIEKFESDDI